MAKVKVPAAAESPDPGENVEVKGDVDEGSAAADGVQLTGKPTEEFTTTKKLEKKKVKEVPKAASTDKVPIKVYLFA